MVGDHEKHELNLIWDVFPYNYTNTSIVQPIQFPALNYYQKSNNIIKIKFNRLYILVSPSQSLWAMVGCGRRPKSVR